MLMRSHAYGELHLLRTLKKLLLATGAGASWDLPKAATSQMPTNPGAPLLSGVQAASFKLALSLPGDRPKPPTFFNGNLYWTPSANHVYQRDHLLYCPNTSRFVICRSTRRLAVREDVMVVPARPGHLMAYDQTP